MSGVLSTTSTITALLSKYERVQKQATTGYGPTRTEADRAWGELVAQLDAAGVDALAFDAATPADRERMVAAAIEQRASAAAFTAMISETRGNDLGWSIAPARAALEVPDATRAQRQLTSGFQYTPTGSDTPRFYPRRAAAEKVALTDNLFERMLRPLLTLELASSSNGRGAYVQLSKEEVRFLKDGQAKWSTDARVDLKGISSMINRIDEQGRYFVEANPDPSAKLRQVNTGPVLNVKDDLAAPGGELITPAFRTTDARFFATESEAVEHQQIVSQWQRVDRLLSYADGYDRNEQPYVYHSPQEVTNFASALALFIEKHEGKDAAVALGRDPVAYRDTYRAALLKGDASAPKHAGVLALLNRLAQIDAQGREWPAA